MHGEDNTWALVLAAGEGTRLRQLTTSSSGVAIPKQYCSLHGGASLLQNAIVRAGAVAPLRRTCAVVAEQHRPWWQDSLSDLPGRNVIVQPSNRGTANGILLPLLHILQRDPDAKVVLLPSDHHVRQEAVLAGSLRRAVEQLDWRFDEMLLLGIRPEEPDPELGYIVPTQSDGRGALRVRRFVEKPAPAQASALVAQGALWNVFIIASTGQALLELFRRRMPEVVPAMRSAVQRDQQDGGCRAIQELYSRLPNLDFSRDVLPGEEEHLRVLPVSSCGWSDLGTPKRVAETLRDSAGPGVAYMGPGFGQLSLATQHASMGAC